MIRVALLFAAGLDFSVWRTQAATAQAAVATNAADRITEINSRSSLVSFAKPWHLKLSVAIPDEHGKDTEGSIETWRAGAESRTVAFFAGGTATMYEHSGDRYQSQKGPAIPQIVYDALDAVVHPGPEESQLAGTIPELRTQNFDKLTLDCVMLNRPIKLQSGRLPAVVPLGLFPTWCVLPKTDHLQLSYSFGNPTVLVTGLGKFGDLEVVTGVKFVDGTSTLAHAKVGVLSTFAPTENEFTPPAGSKRMDTSIPTVQGSLIKSQKLSGATPQYPVSARMAHISGAVVLHVIIGTDGHIKRLTVASAPDPDLAVSALLAVRTWTYKPYLLNGEPASIDTTITVNYDLSPG